MGKNRKNYMYKIEYIIWKIINYWCLIRYARLSNKMEKIGQWKHELLKLFFGVIKFDLKKNNTELNRRHTLKEMSNLYDLKLRDTINHINWLEFRDEGVDVDTDPIYRQTVNEYIKELKKIIILIAKQDRSEIRAYIEKL